MNSFGKILKEKRERTGISQADVAKKLGYSSPQFISNWERNLSTPPVTSLRTLAQLYKMSADNLFQVYLKTSLKVLETDLKKRFSKRRST